MPEIRYDKLCGELERMIGDGTFRERLPGVHKLAELLGANHITVRKAVERLVEDGVLEVIPSRGTFIRLQERTVRDFHVIGCIGICCASGIRKAVIDRQNEQLQNSGYQVLDITAAVRIFKENPRLLLQFPADGYIFCGSSLSRRILEFLLDNHIPVISTINSRFPEISHVGMDHFSGYAEALRTLVRERRCRRIAFLGYRRYGDFQNYIEDIRDVFIRELGPAFEPRLFSVYPEEDYFLRYGEDCHGVVVEDCIRSWRKPLPDGLITIPETVPFVRRLAPSVAVSVFAPYGSQCESEVVMYEDLPKLLDAAPLRMLELLNGDTGITETKIRFIMKQPPRGCAARSGGPAV